MSVPAFLLTVDGEVNVEAVFLAPFVDDFLIINEVVLGTGAVYDVNLAVTVTVVTAVVDYGT